MRVAHHFQANAANKVLVRKVVREASPFWRGLIPFEFAGPQLRLDWRESRSCKQ